MQDVSCFLCRKHEGLEAAPPGGYIHQGAHWLVCHAPAERGPLGTLFIESRRHFLDPADLSETEATRFGLLLRQIYGALRPLTGAERIYQVSMMEGIPHFHAWIVPRGPKVAERGIAFLARELTCTHAEAASLAASLRDAAKEW